MNAYILTGGKSRRMGQDKSLMKLGELTFAEFLYNNLETQFDSVTLIGKKQTHPHLPFARDNQEIQCALNGLATALNHSNTPWNFIISVDMPLVSAGLISSLKDNINDEVNSVVPTLDGKSFPTCAWYHKSMERIFVEAIEHEKYKLLYHVKRNAPKMVNAEKFRKDLLNVNTPTDYLLLKKFMI